MTYTKKEKICDVMARYILARINPVDPAVGRFSGRGVMVLCLYEYERALNAGDQSVFVYFRSFGALRSSLL